MAQKIVASKQQLVFPNPATVNDFVEVNNWRTEQNRKNRGENIKTVEEKI